MTADGELTLLFSDIEGSTRILDQLGDRYADLLAEHDRIMRDAIAATGGRAVSTAGDSFFAVFERAGDAADCAVRAQLSLATGKWPDGCAPRVRMGIHSGQPTVRGDDFLGMDVHRAARVMAVSHGGQVLLTDETRLALGSSVELRDLGHHRLKDLPSAEHLFQILAPGLECEFPPLRSLNRSNLPTPANPLIGRRAEVDHALGLLAKDGVRLLTLLGVGGAGKSRLAVEIAAEAVTRYRDGVWVVFLAPIGDRELLVSELARVLEIEPVAGEPLERTIGSALSERELLLVLDNFEHLIDAAEIAAELLAAAPRVDVLATSREPLRVSGEHRIDVPPLPLADAAELFLARARAVRPDLGLDDTDRVAVEGICRRLDGLPLALEMAAARAAVFSPRALEAQLSEGLPLPAGPRDLPERQRTLHATIDWSYRLLELPEQVLFAALATFVDGARIDAVEQIWGVDAVEALISLAEKNLLRRREDRDGTPRFWMLETIRQFAADRAATDGMAADAAERHAGHFFELTERAAPHLIGPDQRRWLDRLECDHANLRAALEHLAGSAPVRALRMTATLTWFWEMRGYEPEARRRLTEVLALSPVDSPSRGEALFCAGWAAWSMGEPEAARSLELEALPLLQAPGDERLLAQLYSHLGMVAEMLREPADVTLGLHEQAIATARAAGDDWALGVALNNHAIARPLRHDSARALSILDEAMSFLRRSGDAFMIAMTAGNIAESSLDVGDLDRAEAMNHEALTLDREHELRPMLASALVTEALIALERGDPTRAASLLRETLAIGSLFQMESRAMLLTATAALAARAGGALQAATLWGSASAIRGRVGLAELGVAARLRAAWQPQAQATVDDQHAWDAAWQTGADMSVGDALSLAATVVDRVDSPDNKRLIRVPGEAPATQRMR